MRRVDRIQQAAVMNHRQVETATIPGYQPRRIAFQAAEKSLQQVLLVGIDIAQGPDLELLAAAQHRGYGDDTMQVVAQEIAARLLPPHLENRARHVIVGQSV